MIPPDDVFEGSYLVRLRRSAPGIDVWMLEITIHPDDERDAFENGCVQQWRPFVRGNLVAEADPWAAFLIAAALAWSTAQRRRRARRGILMGRPLSLPGDFRPTLPPPADPDEVVFATGAQAMRVRERITMRVPIPAAAAPVRSDPPEVVRGPKQRGVDAQLVERAARGVCPTCEKPLRYEGGETRTLVGYGYAKNGHAHDDNCALRGYSCPDGHRFVLSVVRRCEHDPPCDWRGKESCFCHVGPKLDAWPDVPRAERLQIWMR